MSITYTPTTNFGSKDTLPANDPNKVIVGGEFTFEFNAIQAAFALAAPTSNPTFTGTSTFGTLNAGTTTVGTFTATGTSTLGTLNAGTTTVGTFTSTGIDDNATSTAITIDSAEDVGIGDTDPTSKLSVQSGNSSRPIAARSTTTGAYVAFTDATTTSLGHVKVGAEADNLALFAGAQARMKVFSGGNVGIGTDSPIAGSKLTVKDGFISVDTAGAETMRMQTATGESRVASSDDLVFRAGGTSSVSSDRMRITDVGDVGIGTDSPLSKLDVQSSRNTTLTLTSSTNDAGYTDQYYGKIDFTALDGSGAGSGVPRASIGAISPTAAGAAGELTFSTGSAVAPIERVRIDSSGNVGIGETAPERQLVVSGTGAQRMSIVSTDGSGATLLFGDADNDAQGQLAYINSDDSMRFSTAGSSEMMRIDVNGNVGINVIDPDERLEVGGDIKSAVGGNAGVYHFGGASDQTKITGRDSSHPTLPDTMEFATGGTARLAVKNTGQLNLTPIASAPSSPSAGDLYFDSTTNKLRCYDGTTWQDCF